MVKCYTKNLNRERFIYLFFIAMTGIERILVTLS